MLLETRLRDPKKATADTTYLRRYVIPGVFMCVLTIAIIILVVLFAIWDSASSSTILRDVFNI